MIKERPILFSAPMVRAILEGRKTVTRRVMKPQPHPDFLARGVHSVVPQWPNQDGVRWFMEDGCSELVKCPHGKPGDRLWVREAHAFVPEPAYRRSTGIYQQINPSDAYEACVYRENFDRARNFPWRPSIHMPRWASRILLEITDVRVERLQDISEEQALTEGVHYDSPHRAYFGTDTGGIACNSARCAFADLWQSINGPGSWDANPWVWAVSFKVIQPSQEQHHD